MMLTTKGRYAVTSLIDIACIDQLLPVNLKDIALRQNLPHAYLESIFCKLKNAGLVKAVKGPGGGYSLARPLGQISIKEIIDAVEEKIQMTKCGNMPNKSCVPNGAKCFTHDLWNGLSQHISDYLSNISIQDVVESNL